MKYIPPLLQTHLDAHVTTMCFLLKIVPVNAPAFGVTSLDQDVTYDDGDGGTVYSSAMGLNQSAIDSSDELAVDNSEAMVLIHTTFTREMLAAGLLDYASFFVYRINWADPSMGHYILQTGRTGEVRQDNELAGIIELRGTAQELKQNYMDLYSLTCRAPFGSTYSDAQFACTFNAEALWQNDTVASVGTETDREFIMTTTPAATGPNGALPFDVALIQFLTGDNAGLTVETETVDTGTKEIALRFNAAYPIQIGDTFKIRPDCQKRYTEDCIALYANGLNFRGEPWIPLTEENSSGTPGANVPGYGSDVGFF